MIERIVVSMVDAMVVRPNGLFTKMFIPYIEYERMKNDVAQLRKQGVTGNLTAEVVQYDEEGQEPKIIEAADILIKVP